MTDELPDNDARPPAEALAAAMRALPAEAQLDIEPVHLFAPGIYVRVLHMPAGACIVSKIHKTEHFCLALDGRVTVVIDGEGEQEIVGPKLMRTLPGTQRSLLVHEPATWITFHPVADPDTTLTEADLPAIEARLIAEDFDDPQLAAYFGGREAPAAVGHDEEDGS